MVLKFVANGVEIFHEEFDLIALFAEDKQSLLLFET